MPITTKIYLNFAALAFQILIFYILSKFLPGYEEWGFLPALGLLIYLFWQVHSEILQPGLILNQKAKAYLNFTSGWSFQSRKSGFYRSINQVVKNTIFQLERARQYISELKSGKLDIEFRDTDLEENALFDELKALKDKLVIFDEEKTQRNWINEGLTRFVDVLQEHNNDLKELGDQITAECVSYLDVNQAWLYIVNEDEKEEKYLELCSCYAWDRKKFLKKTIRAGEGLAGQVLYEKKRILMTRVPNDYVKVSSGSGEANPGCILIFPLKINDEMYGVLELVAFQTPKDYQIDFMEELADNIALEISSIKNAEHTNSLLEKAQHQAEVLRAQEEELRQNMEELQAIQEKLKMEREEQEKLRIALVEEQNLFAAFLNTTSDQIYFKDHQSKFMRVSDCMAQKFDVESPQDLIGKTDFDIFGYEHAQQAYDDEQRIIKTGVPLLDIEEKETWRDGTITWAHTSKIPLKNAEGEIIGTFGISRDITDRKITQEALAREKKMLDAFLFNTPHLVFFKSPEGQIIRASQSFAKFMGHNSIQEIIGKRECDYFTPNSAEHITKKDKQVIKQGQAAISQLMKEQMANGKDVELLTHRFPIASTNGEPMGIFGIYEPVNKPLFKQN